MFTTTTVTQPGSPVLKLRPVTEAALAERKRVKERLAGAFRLFARLGYDEGVAGHISVRDPIDPSAFWVNPYGKAFDHMTTTDLLLIGQDGSVLEGSGTPGNGQLYNAAGFAIHHAIHMARPDIHAAAHSHSFYGRAFSALGRNIDLCDFESAQYAHTVKLYDDFGGVVLSNEEGKRICEALGPEGKGVILKNHGILTAAASVEAAVAYFVRLEKLCEAQLAADASGGAVGLPDEQVRAVFGQVGGEENAIEQAEELYAWLEAQEGEEYKL